MTMTTHPLKIHRSSTHTTIVSPHRTSRRFVVVLVILLIISNLFALILHIRLFLQPSTSSSSSSFLLYDGGTSSVRQQQFRRHAQKAYHLQKQRKFKRRIRRRVGINGTQTPLQLLPLQDKLQLRHHHNTNQQQHQTLIRYDAVADVFDKGAYGVVHQLPCIPDRRRMIINGNHFDHRNKIHNLTYFLEGRLLPHEQDRPLYIYNPMLLPLNVEMLQYDSILKYLEFNRTSVGDAKASYIAVYRVSNFGNCHGSGRGLPETYRNYLGIALLDIDLNILPREEEVINSGDDHQYFDVVIDLNRHLADIGWSPTKTTVRDQIHHRRHVEEDEPVKQHLQDCQLIAVPSSSTAFNSKADKLILICNNFAMEVRLERVSSSASTTASTHNKGDAIRFTNTYGSGLQLTALAVPRSIIKGGKNLHYFRATDFEDVHKSGYPGRSGEGEGYIEVWPGGPHESMHIDFSNRGNMANSIYGNDVMVKSEQEEPEVTFLTLDSAMDKSPLISRDSGSACCISVLWKDVKKDDDDVEGSRERRVLLGVSHRKTRRGLGKKNPPYNYVSRVYAFESTPPFNIVARSGFFCLGFALKNSNANDEVNESDNEQIWGAANEYKLTINGIVFEHCPAIHFVTGIADKLGDEERTAIVSYGVNDCYPRMVEVSKKFLVSLLQPLT